MKHTREHKYRAWDKVGGVMITSKELENQVWNIYGSMRNPSNSDWIFLEFTGLKDKSGKEIYEGDILRWSHPDFKENKVEYKILEMQDIRKSHMIFPDCHAGYIEIIGNVWENPELLK